MLYNHILLDFFINLHLNISKTEVVVLFKDRHDDDIGTNSYNYIAVNGSTVNKHYLVLLLINTTLLISFNEIVR